MDHGINIYAMKIVTEGKMKNLVYRLIKRQVRGYYKFSTIFNFYKNISGLGLYVAIVSKSRQGIKTCFIKTQLETKIFDVITYKG